MKIVFLDRDGTINRFPGNGTYVTKLKDFHILPGALEAIKVLTENGYKICVVSNQAGVGRGVFSADKLKRIDARLVKHVLAAGGKIHKSFYCTHRPDAGCECRKPGIGLVKQALSSLGQTIGYAKKTFFVGDTDKDIQTGHKAGCKTILVLSGRDTRQSVKKWDVKPDYIVKDLKEAADIIQHENSSHPRNSRGRA